MTVTIQQPASVRGVERLPLSLSGRLGRYMGLSAALIRAESANERCRWRRAARKDRGNR